MNTAYQQQASRINDALHVIHKNIAADLTARHLADIAAYSEQHFHRVFKRVVGETVNVYIRRIRLEHAANQLMFDQNSRVVEIAEKCGFSSLSSFTRIFKSKFGTTPAQWRLVRRTQARPPYLQDPEISAGYQRVANNIIASPTLQTLDELHVAYVRHKGYGRDIGQAWQILRLWAAAQQRAFGKPGSDDLKLPGQQIGLHHSNPEWVPLNDCQYVACLTIDRPILQRSLINTLTIPGGLHAVFELAGQYGDLLPLIGKIQNNWLPNSGYVMQTTPMLIHYRQNHLLGQTERFNVQLFIPISIS